QTRAVNGFAALVTTPLRFVVTRAPSDQASVRRQAFACHMACAATTAAAFARLRPDYRDPQAPLDAAPPLARDLMTPITVGGSPVDQDVPIYTLNH
ncbi:MAG: hypothetical protein GY935_25515, partial [Gammaproteobacteria bacterium]|nr:hypothetical protein [Gammaproteobacteria bacterium]